MWKVLGVSLVDMMGSNKKRKCKNILLVKDLENKLDKERVS